MVAQSAVEPVYLRKIFNFDTRYEPTLQLFLIFRFYCRIDSRDAGVMPSPSYSVVASNTNSNLSAVV